MTRALGESPARVHALVDFYRRTHYRVSLSDHEEATIRIGEPPPATLAGWIGGTGFAVFLSACNPRSQALAPAVNARRSAHLRHRLDALGARCLPGHGVLPATTWSEDSVLVSGPDLAAIDALACEFEQNASVITTAGATARLRIYRDDWRDLVTPRGDIEWATGAAIAH